MSTHKQVPEIRFKGFDGIWEEQELDNLASFSKGNGYTKGDLTNTGTQILLYGRLYTKYETVIEDLDTFVELKPNSVISQGGEVVVPASGETAIDISRASVIEKPGVILGGDLNVIKPSATLDSTFLALTISNGTQQKEMTKRAQGSSVVHLHNSDLKRVELLYPSKPEQEQIGTFFKQIDKNITLQQRKLDLLKTQKQGYLQKMFPKNGQKVPELRFKGFADDWEERKLGELSQDTFGGGTPKTSVTEYWNGEIPWIQSSDLSSDHLFGVLPKKHITENAVKNSATKLIPKNSIAIVTRVGVGKLAFMPYEFTSSQDFLSLSNLQVDCNFGMYSIYKMLQRELNNIQGTSIKGITKADLLDKEVIIPVEFEEQQRIGSFFKQLDDTIALHQRKLDLLKEQKKGFLQKMFP